MMIRKSTINIQTKHHTQKPLENVEIWFDYENFMHPWPTKPNQTIFIPHTNHLVLPSKMWVNLENCQL